MAGTTAPRINSAGMIVVDTTTTERQRRILPSQGKECVMDTFGISLNTWAKTRRAEAVPNILINRVSKRHDCAQHIHSDDFSFTTQDGAR